jgi:hypothetical protein
MDFPIGYALSLSYQHTSIDFFVQGNPDGELCITCPHTIFHQRFSGGTKCFHPFISAPFIPDETDEHYEFFLNMKMEILKAWAELNGRE